MTHTKILEEIKKLSNTERLEFITVALNLIREDLQIKERLNEIPLSVKERKEKMAIAAKTLLPDYSMNGELTIFTGLDSEDFYV